MNSENQDSQPDAIVEPQIEILGQIARDEPIQPTTNTSQAPEENCAQKDQEAPHDPAADSVPVEDVENSLSSEHKAGEPPFPQEKEDVRMQEGSVEDEAEPKPEMVNEEQDLQNDWHAAEDALAQSAGEEPELNEEEKQVQMGPDVIPDRREPQVPGPTPEPVLESNAELEQQFAFGEQKIAMPTCPQNPCCDMEQPSQTLVTQLPALTGSPLRSQDKYQKITVDLPPEKAIVQKKFSHAKKASSEAQQKWLAQLEEMRNRIQEQEEADRRWREDQEAQKADRLRREREEHRERLRRIREKNAQLLNQAHAVKDANPTRGTKYDPKQMAHQKVQQNKNYYSTFVDTHSKPMTLQELKKTKPQLFYGNPQGKIGYRRKVNQILTQKPDGSQAPEQHAHSAFGGGEIVNTTHEETERPMTFNAQLEVAIEPELKKPHTEQPAQLTGEEQPLKAEDLEKQNE